MLLNYERYVQLGGTLTAAEYPTYELICETTLKTLSGGKFPSTEKAEMCMMLLLNAYQKADNLPPESRATSVSNDGVSVSYSVTETPSGVIIEATDRIKIILASEGINTSSALGVRHRV